MVFDADVVMQWLQDIMLPFVRISALLIAMVGFSGKRVPTKLRVLFALSVAFILAPVIPPVPQYDLVSMTGFLLVFQQILIGVAIGFVSQIFMNTFVLAGQVVATQTGLGFSTIIDPVSGINIAAIGQFYLILATLIFWAVDGHLIMIQMIAYSFEAIPIHHEGWLEPIKFMKIVEWGKWLFIATITLTLTPVTAMLIITFTFGVMTRAAPQLNIFSIGFPITQLGGLIVIWLSLSAFMLHFDIMWASASHLMCDIAGC
ncbi:flagellar type III secretion system protein FliR [Catenovulum sp. SM1970]|uniref:flagellar biosynthetic protein FliR n=1 Tax=Marinifaba aquimaris TaxID=2741323 RepID=UPI001571E508|nr:flagellar biosynthetic protein FliR [Marinifaba aquimaris]NTS76383.1 flagellar type III secretion system protein FliR [Marinifaba aquimaris]